MLIYMYIYPCVQSRVMKDMSRGHHGEEFEAIMNAYVECYNFVVTITLDSSQDDVSEGDIPALEPLVIKVRIIVCV